VALGDKRAILKFIVAPNTQLISFQKFASSYLLKIPKQQTWLTSLLIQRIPDQSAMEKFGLHQLKPLCEYALASAEQTLSNLLVL
jgi:hypothetical protein